VPASFDILSGRTTWIVCAVWLACDHQVAAQSRFDQAVELLDVATSCPTKPVVEEQQEPVNASGTYRIFTTLKFTGSTKTFHIRERIERRLHDHLENTVSIASGESHYEAPFSSIAAVDIVGSDRAGNPILGLSCKEGSCIKDVNDPNNGNTFLELPFCDATVDEAKLSIEILSGLTEPDSRQGRSFELFKDGNLSGKNLGDFKTGVSTSECLRACRLDKNCHAFTVLKGDTSDCQLKSSVGILKVGEEEVSGVLDGLKPELLEHRIRLHPATDFKGIEYLNRRNISLEDCASICQLDDNCSAFSFVRSKRWCWLKSGTVSPSVSTDNIVSGLKSPPK